MDYIDGLGIWTSAHPSPGPRPPRIAIAGKMFSGKSIVADHLVKAHGYTRMAFADDVKQLCRDLFNMQGKDRPLLQSFGMHLRELDPMVWIRRVENKLGAHQGKTIVIDDVRLPNELRWVRENGFHVIRMVATPELQKQRMAAEFPDMDPATMGHISETALDQYDMPGAPRAWDYTIRNDGVSMDELLDQVDRVLADITLRCRHGRNG